MTIILFILLFLLDIAPDPVATPFKFGWAGSAFAVAFGLFLSAIAMASFFLFRKKLSILTRAIAAVILLFAALGGTVLLLILLPLITILTPKTSIRKKSVIKDLIAASLIPIKKVTAIRTRKKTLPLIPTNNFSTQLTNL